MSDSSNDSNLSEVQKLIRLKRYEQPTGGFDAYCEDFLFEFQQRQRVEMLRRSSFSLWLEKVASWFWSFGTSKWVWGGAAAYASVMMFAYLRSDPNDALQAGDESGGVQPQALGTAQPHSATPVSQPNNPGTEKPGSKRSGGMGGIQPVSAPVFKEL